MKLKTQGYIIVDTMGRGYMLERSKSGYIYPTWTENVAMVFPNYEAARRELMKKIRMEVCDIIGDGYHKGTPEERKQIQKELKQQIKIIRLV